MTTIPRILSISLVCLVCLGCEQQQQYEEIPLDIQRKSEAAREPLEYAILQNDLEAVRAALAAGADPNSIEGLDLQPLHLAARYGAVEIGEELIRQNADVNRTSDYEVKDENGEKEVRKGRTPLHVAVASNQLDFVRMLLKNDADVNAKNGHNMTPLDVAIGKGDLLLVTMEEKDNSVAVAEQITKDISINESMTELLKSHGGVATDELEEQALREIEGGGLLQKIEENIEELKLKRETGFLPADASDEDSPLLPGLPADPRFNPDDDSIDLNVDDSLELQEVDAGLDSDETNASDEDLDFLQTPPSPSGRGQK